MKPGQLFSTLSYAANEIWENGDERYWWRDRFINRVISPIHKHTYDTDAAINPFDADSPYGDWDTLVILDACRADLFAEVLPDQQSIPDEFETVQSPASATPEWTRILLADASLGDTVCVTANPWIARLAPDTFHDRFDVWQDGADESLGVVPPDQLVDAAEAARDQYPEKRLFIHFMQPHVPFIGAERWQRGNHTPEKILEGSIEDDGHDGEFGTIRYGDGDRDALWADYRATLNLALAELPRLRDAIAGRMVVSADHGNMFGERAWPIPYRIYGHPGGLRSPELIEVPWAVYETAHDRPSTTDGGARHIPVSGSEETVSDRLQALGYRG